MKRASLIRAMLADQDRWEQGLEVGATLAGIEPPPAELVRAVVTDAGCGGTARRLAFALCAIWICAARERRLQPELRLLILGWTEGLQRRLESVPTRRYGYSRWWGDFLLRRGDWKTSPKRPIQRLLLAQAGRESTAARQWIETLALAGLDRAVTAHRAKLITKLSRLLVADHLPGPAFPIRPDEMRVAREAMGHVLAKQGRALRAAESAAEVHAQIGLWGAA